MQLRSRSQLNRLILSVLMHRQFQVLAHPYLAAKLRGYSHQRLSELHIAHLRHALHQ